MGLAAVLLFVDLHFCQVVLYASNEYKIAMNITQRDKNPSSASAEPADSDQRMPGGKYRDHSMASSGMLP